MTLKKESLKLSLSLSLSLKKIRYASQKSYTYIPKTSMMSTKRNTNIFPTSMKKRISIISSRRNVANIIENAIQCPLIRCQGLLISVLSYVNAKFAKRGATMMSPTNSMMVESICVSWIVARDDTMTG